MPKRTDIHSILIIGAGPIVIGQACEFDYSGAQACKALRAEGYRVVLVNSNPATIMTDPQLADATYIEPITPEFVEKIIARESTNVPQGRVFALLPTMGGQTALNTALSLRKRGVLEKYDVELIGASAEAIDKAEDRELFRRAMMRIGLDVPRGVTLKGYLRHKKDERGNFLYDGQNNPIMELSPEAFAHALQALDEVGLPAVIRPSFTLGGTGGGIAYNREEYFDTVEQGLDASPTNEVLIEESVLGWKEYEMEVVRDRADNAIIVCSIENVDAMGVHTGDSITVAPTLTLTDKEYQRMRGAAITVLREIGVETGGSNVQFAVNPADGRMVVIEMNPRVSRSSALASKATGFPIAKIAARLAVGYTLDELQNDITRATPASFEPTIDYVVTKIPRFAFEKFPDAEITLTTSMKSVGEVMAIGRTFAESLQKALRSLETGLGGLDEIELPDDPNAIRAALARTSPDRLRVAAQAMRMGFPVSEIAAITRYDHWFLGEIETILAAEARLSRDGLPTDAETWRRTKSMGFSDARLARLGGRPEKDVRRARIAAGIRPVYKRIDSCAAEFLALTPYMYSTYEHAVGARAICESKPTTARKIIILGGGPNRIGQGIEFDYCCCHAAYALSAQGFETIMVNCNPETVSTDYDTSDRLYFEPLTAEDLLEIVHIERSAGDLAGVIVQFGGQTPLKLARTLVEEGVPILGTSADAIDLAEDRRRFQIAFARTRLETAPQRHRDDGGGDCFGRWRNRIPSHSAPLLCAGWTRNGRRLRRSAAQIGAALGRIVQDFRPECGADRRLPAARDRDRCGRHCGRNRRRIRRRNHGAHRGGRRAFGRLRLRNSAAFTQCRNDCRDRTADDRARPCAGCARIDECAIRRAGSPDFRSRGQPSREPHRPIRRQGHRPPCRSNRRARNGRRDPCLLLFETCSPESHRGKGGGDAVLAFSGC